MTAEGERQYGTFQQPAESKKVTEQPADVEEEKLPNWEIESSPWRLFLSSTIVIGKNLATLLLLYWTLLWGPAAKKNLMLCWNPPHLSVWEQFGCEYTKAWVRSFPLLSAIVVLVISLRLMVQQRIYYGFLKEGALLDFNNIAPQQDPLLILLFISILHAIVHFVLKMQDGQGDIEEEVESVVMKFLAPYVIFLIFLYSSYDIEQLLVPLNKYVEEDPDFAKRALANIHFLEEDVVRHIVKAQDVIGEVVEAKGPDDVSVAAMYHEIIRRYPEAKGEMPEPDHALTFHLKNAMWPGSLLIDPRLTDEGSTSFRFMFSIFMIILVLVQVVVCFFLCYQAFYKDIYLDVYLNGHYMDIAGAVVLVMHVGFVFWLLSVTLWPVIVASTAAQSRRVSKLARGAAGSLSRTATTMRAKMPDAEAPPVAPAVADPAPASADPRSSP